MNYREGYQEHLEGIMAKGGAIDAVNDAFAEFNRIENPDWVGGTLFNLWVAGVKHLCCTCDAIFTTAVEVKPLTEIRCTRCLPHSTTPAGGISDAATPPSPSHPREDR